MENINLKRLRSFLNELEVRREDLVSMVDEYTDLEKLIYININTIDRLADEVNELINKIQKL